VKWWCVYARPVAVLYSTWSANTHSQAWLIVYIVFDNVYGDEVVARHFYPDAFPSQNSVYWCRGESWIEWGRQWTVQNIHLEDGVQGDIAEYPESTVPFWCLINLDCEWDGRCRIRCPTVWRVLRKQVLSTCSECIVQAHKITLEERSCFSGS
jgi:hypothetical protein